MPRKRVSGSLTIIGKIYNFLRLLNLDLSLSFSFIHVLTFVCS